MDTNPIPEFENTNAILSGTYEAVFRGCEAMERPKFDGSPGLETVIKLYFEVPAEGDVSAAALTVEPESGSPQPTSPIRMLGQLKRSW